MKKANAWIVLLAPLAGGCSGGNSGTSGGPCGFEHRGVGATAQFHEDQACATNPFPSDLMRSGDVVTLPGERFASLLPQDGFDQARTYFQSIAAGLDVDGFSAIGPIYVSLDREVNPASAAGGVQFFRFDAAGTAAVPDATAFVATWDADRSSLILQPQTPLVEGTIYGVVVNNDLVDLLGQPTTRSRGYGDFIPTAPPEIGVLTAAAGAAGTTSDRIAVAFTFRTQTLTPQMVAVRDRVFGTLGSSLQPIFDVPSTIPGLSEGIFVNGSPEFITSLEGEDGTNIGSIVNGTFDSFNFRGTDGIFDDALVNGPSAPGTEHLIFRMTLPPGVAPGGGWPLVIYQHGLGGSEVDVYEWGNKLSLRGYAVVGIAAIAHGRRPPADVISFFHWDSMPATRESLRQTNADQLQLLRLLANGKAAGIAPFDSLDVANVSYFGISLGGILGSGFLSLAPGCPRGLLVVPGGHLSNEIYAQAVAENYFWPFIGANSGVDPLDPEFPKLLKGFEPLVQTGLDRGDPVHFAQRIVTPGNQFPGVPAKDILMIEAENDHWVPNIANEALRRSLGIPVLTTPLTAAGGANGTWIYRYADFSSRYPNLGVEEPHGYFSDLCEAQEQGFHWLETGGTEIIDPLSVPAGCP